MRFWSWELAHLAPEPASFLRRWHAGTADVIWVRDPSDWRAIELG